MVRKSRKKLSIGYKQIFQIIVPTDKRPNQFFTQENICHDILFFHFKPFLSFTHQSNYPRMRIHKEYPHLGIMSSK